MDAIRVAVMVKEKLGACTRKMCTKSVQQKHIVEGSGETDFVSGFEDLKGRASTWEVTAVSREAAAETMVAVALRSDPVPKRLCRSRFDGCNNCGCDGVGTLKAMAKKMMQQERPGSILHWCLTKSRAHTQHGTCAQSSVRVKMGKLAQ